MVKNEIKELKLPLFTETAFFLSDTFSFTTESYCKSLKSNITLEELYWDLNCGDFKMFLWERQLA